MEKKLSAACLSIKSQDSEIFEQRSQPYLLTGAAKKRSSMLRSSDPVDPVPGFGSDPFNPDYPVDPDPIKPGDDPIDDPSAPQVEDTPLKAPEVPEVEEPVDDPEAPHVEDPEDDAHE